MDLIEQAIVRLVWLNQQQQAKLEALQLLYSRDGLHKDGIKQGAVMCIAP